MDGICNCLYSALQQQLSNLDSILNNVNSQSDIVSGLGNTGTIQQSISSLNNVSPSNTISDTSVVMLSLISLGVAALLVLRNNTERQIYTDTTDKIRHNNNNDTGHRRNDDSDSNAT